LARRSRFQQRRKANKPDGAKVQRF
jgi:hypothetical protein